MELQFLGATGTVTGSKFLVTTAAGHRVLVDCGLFQGYKQLRLRNWAPPPCDPAGVNAVVLTHAHIDHSGYLPLFARAGFRGRVHCSEATHELCRILLADSAHLQEEQAEHANRFGWSKHVPALPLYTRADVDRVLPRFAPAPFGARVEIAPGVVATLAPAGHILGAAIVSIEADGRRLVFSGDLGRDDDPIMRPPEAIERADALVCESTYGDRLHDRGDTAPVLASIVSRTAGRGGVVVMPAFAVGRAQALMLMLHRLKAQGAIPRLLQVFLDSPMACDVTALYVRFASQHRLGREECEAMAQAARQVATPEESARLDQSHGPMVILAGSGMATGGRVLHHLKRFAPDPRNAIVLAGFQAGGTRGADLARGVAEVKIFGEYVPVRAEVHELEGLSAHADSGEILAWFRQFQAAPARTFLTHGEPGAADVLRRRVQEQLGWRCDVPDYLEKVEI